MRPFGEFSPDVSDLNTDTLDIARNVLPGVNSYLPAPGLIAQSADVLPLPCKGLWYVQTSGGDYDTYLATAEKLYKFDADTLTFVDVSRLAGGAYGLPADDYWDGVQYGDRLIVCNLGNTPQYIDINVGTNFADLPNAPTARLVDVMDDHVVFSCLSSNARSIQWSAINDSEDYTTGTSGTQEFADAGEVTGFCPHAAIVLLQRGLRGIISTGDAYAFSFPPMSSEKGTVAPWSVIEFGALAYWLSDNGFYVGNANEQRSISEKRISGYFYNNLNAAQITHIYAALDPHASRLYWAYPSSDTAWNDRVLVYDWGLDRWSELEIDTYILSRLATASISLDSASFGANLDAPGLPSLDSFFYRAGSLFLSAVSTDLRLSTMEGVNLPALIETGSYQFGGNQRVRLRSVLAFIEGDSAENVTVRVSKRQRYGDDWAVSGAIPQQLSGRYPMNADGMFHRFEFSFPAGSIWSHAHGWEPDFAPTTAR